MAVSVVMATYNGAAYIEPQLRSILQQLSAEDELVISDDGSTDRTLELIPTDPRIRLMRGPQAGTPANFSAALAAARNEVVFLSDQDDVWEPHKIRAQSGALNQALLVVSDARVIDREGHTLHESYFALNRSGPGVVRNIVRNGFLGCCMAFRRDLLKLAMPLPTGVAHDWWLGLCASVVDKVLFMPDQLVQYRRHGGAASLAASTKRRPLSLKLRDRWRVGVALIDFRLRPTRD
jgi:glycosyltransferase involved in cell wall biosynthesis